MATVALGRLMRNWMKHHCPLTPAQSQVSFGAITQHCCGQQCINVLIALSLDLHVVCISILAAVFIHEDDMAFVVVPGRNDSQTPHERERRNAVLDSAQIWPGGIVPYQIASVFNGK